MFYIKDRMSVITVEELQAYTGTTAATDTTAVNAVNAYINRITGRSWGAIETVTELHDYAPTIFLRNMDVQSITSVKRDYGSDQTTLVADTDYRFNDLGRLTLSYGRASLYPALRDYIEVVYTHGVLTVPDDLKLAALALAKDFGSYATDSGEVSSRSIGSYRLEFKHGSQTSTGQTYFDVIDGYRAARV